MSVLAAPWHRILQTPLSRKVMLLTLWPSSGPPVYGPPLRQANSLLLSTHTDVVVTDTLGPFPRLALPWLLNWPTIDISFSPTDRRAAIAQTSITVGGGAELDEFLGDRSAQTLLGELALWSDGIDVADRIPLMRGPVRNPQKGITGAYTFDLSDGSPERTAKFPPGPFNLSDFPEASDAVISTAQRHYLFHRAPDHVVATPIDGRRDPTAARTFYLWEPFGPEEPTRFFKGGEELQPTDWPVVDRALSGSLFEYTRLTFPRPVNQINAGSDDTITTIGGVGDTSTTPILALLDLGKIPVAPAARSRLAALNLDFTAGMSALVNTPTDVLALVQDRFLPQTRFVPAWRNNELTVIDPLDEAPTMSLSPLTGLFDRVDEKVTQTPDTQVFNDFVMRCGRDLSQSDTTTLVPLFTFHRTATSGDALSPLLSRSKSQFGLRPFKNPNGTSEGFDAGDLIVTRDADNAVIGCPGGDVLLDHLIRLYAFPHKLYSFFVEWYLGMALMSLNWEVLLTYDPENLSDKKTRVVRWRLPATGPLVTFQAVDDE